MTRAVGRGNADDKKLSILQLISELLNVRGVTLAELGYESVCELDRVLNVFTEGGQLRLEFTSASSETALHRAKESIKLFDRGLISHSELICHVLDHTGTMLDAFDDNTGHGHSLQEPLAVEIQRVRSLLIDREEGWRDHIHEDSILNSKYTVDCCRCVVTLLESLVCTDEGTGKLRVQLATALVLAMSDSTLLLTDDNNSWLTQGDVKTIVDHGGTMRVCVLSSEAMKLLSDMQFFIDEWRANRLRDDELCLQLKRRLDHLACIDPDWWDRFYFELATLWMVASREPLLQERCTPMSSAKCAKMSRAVDKIENLVQSPWPIVSQIR